MKTYVKYDKSKEIDLENMIKITIPIIDNVPGEHYDVTICNEFQIIGNQDELKLMATVYGDWDIPTKEINNKLKKVIFKKELNIIPLIIS